MNRWDSLWYGPVASARPLLWEKLFLALLALDVWTQLLARGARYGAAGFNVAHFAWLDALQPAPGPELYVGLMLIVGWLAAFLAWTGHDRLGLAALCGLYTWGWSMSILDSYQHHYLISLALLCLVFLPRRLPGEIGRDTSAWGFQLLRATAAVVYGFAAVAKLDPEWRSGATLARIDGAGALSVPFEWVGVSGGVPPGLLAHAAIVADDTHGGPLPAWDGPGVVAHVLDDYDDRVDLVGRSRILHDNEHQQLGSGGRSPW